MRGGQGGREAARVVGAESLLGSGAEAVWFKGKERSVDLSGRGR